MSRTLSSPTNSAVTSPTTRPAYLVEIQWSPVVRLTTGDALTYGGYVWAQGAVLPDQIEWTGAGGQRAALTLLNTGQEYSALVFNQGTADVPINIWSYDQSAVAAGDAVLVFAGVGGKASADDNRIRIELAQSKSRTLRSPRFRITRGNGFSILPAPETTIRWGAERYVLKDRRWPK